MMERILERPAEQIVIWFDFTTVPLRNALIWRGKNETECFALTTFLNSPAEITEAAVSEN
jgi:hypothetical protein